MTTLEQQGEPPAPGAATDQAGAATGQAAAAGDPRIAAEMERIASLLRAGGRAQDADELIRQFSAPQHAKPALFVAGEDKRGKSCLVNALLRRADLSPVGVEVVTAAPITFTYAREPWAKVFHYGDSAPEQMGFAEAQALATVSGNPRNEHNVRAVQLGVDSPLLEPINLIDTPGVGGLDSGHGALTIQSLRSADALLFVTEAAAQFREEELSFLIRASVRLDTVIIVLTKIDLHRGWRTILEDDAKILSARAPRFANAAFVPVSSVLALRALQLDDPEEAAELRDESGLTRLEDTIRTHVIDRASLLRDANLLRAGHGALGGVMLAARQTLAALADDGETRQALEAERVRLTALQQDKANWPMQLDSEIRKLTLERSREAVQGTVEVKRRYDERLRNVKKHEFDSLPGEFVADLTALAVKLNETAAERLTGLVSQMLSDLDESARLNETIRAATAEALSQDLSDTSLGEFGMSVNDRLGVASQFSSGRSLGGMATAAAGSLIAPPFSIVIGLGIGVMFAASAFLTRDRAAFVAAFQQWSQAEVSKVQTELNTSFQVKMIDIQAELRQAVMKALADRERDITTSLQAAQQIQAEAAGKRAEAQAALQTQFNQARVERGSIEALLNELAPSEPARDQPAAPQAALP